MAMRQGAKQSVLFIFVLVFLTGCSLGLPDFLVMPTGTATRTPTSVMTSTPTPSLTSTQPTSTYTLTPTLVGAKTPTETGTPLPSVTAWTTPTVTTTFTLGPRSPTPRMDGFTYIRLSGNHFYAGGCEPSSVYFLAQAANAGRTAYVILFVRFKSTATDTTSIWTSIAMENLGAGTFAHTLTADEIDALEFFIDPWVQYQLVATDAGRRVIGRTGIFDESLALTTSCTPAPLVTATP